MEDIQEKSRKIPRFFQILIKCLNLKSLSKNSIKPKANEIQYFPVPQKKPQVTRTFCVTAFKKGKL